VYVAAILIQSKIHNPETTVQYEKHAVRGFIHSEPTVKHLDPPLLWVLVGTPKSGTKHLKVEHDVYTKI